MNKELQQGLEWLRVPEWSLRWNELKREYGLVGTYVHTRKVLLMVKLLACVSAQDLNMDNM